MPYINHCVKRTLFNKISSQTDMRLPSYRGKARLLTHKGLQSTNGKGHVQYDSDNTHTHKVFNRMATTNPEKRYTYNDMHVDNHCNKYRVVHSVITVIENIGNIVEIYPSPIQLTQCLNYTPVDNAIESKHLVQYMRTKFFTFCLNQVRVSISCMNGMMRDIPMVDLYTLWTDQKLYKHFNLTEDEIALIEMEVPPKS